MTRRILAIGGTSWGLPHRARLEARMVALTGKPKPKALFLPTATGDDRAHIRHWHATFRRLGCETEDLALLRASDWPRPPADTIARADLIYVGGGSTAGMLALWERFGIVAPLREAYERGAVLGGVSAGGLCWFESGVTDSLDATLKPMACLGWLPGSFCPHYDSEPQRRPVYTALTRSGELPPGLAAEEGVGLLFENERFVGALRTPAGGLAHRVGPEGEKEIAAERV